VFDTAGPAAAAEETVCATSSDSDFDSIFEFHGRRRRRGLLAASIVRQRTPALVRRKPQPVAALAVKQDTLDHLLQFLGLCVFLSVLLFVYSCTDCPLDFHEAVVRGCLPDRQSLADLKPGAHFVDRLAETSIARADNDWLNDEVGVFFFAFP
jgi:hypothetical protein